MTVFSQTLIPISKSGDLQPVPTNKFLQVVEESNRCESGVKANIYNVKEIYNQLVFESREDK